MKHLISIFTTWKEYTNILAMTSAQILKTKVDANMEGLIQKR